MGLTNNDIFKKLRVAHKLRDEDIVAICKLVDFKVSKSELNAFFRNENHPKYMECGDQMLRNFLKDWSFTCEAQCRLKRHLPIIRKKNNRPYSLSCLSKLSAILIIW